MTTLYVDRKGVEIRVDGGALTFYLDNTRIGTVPMAPLSRIVLRGDVQLSASVFGKLGMHNIGVVILSGQKAEPTLFMARPHNDAQRRLCQCQAALSPEFCLNFSRRFISAKLKAQHQLLETKKDTHPDKRYELSKRTEQIKGVLDSVAIATSIESILGLEGAAANLYFQGIAAIAPDGIRFDGRNRRPPKDPLNVILSLGYTLLHSDAVFAIYCHGLDPFVGFYHAPDFGRESLACDIIEPLRPRIDAFALKLFSQQELRVDHFTQKENACTLGKAGRQIFYKSYEAEAESWRKLLQHYIRDLGKQLTGNAFDEEYPSAPDWLNQDDGDSDVS